MSSNEEWKLAVKWFDQCGCLPESLRTKLANNSLTLKDFGMELRNGVMLCNLLNYLMPDSLNLSKVAKHVASSRVMSAYNIGLFQEACIFFELNDFSSVQIDADKLYDLDLSQILQILSWLSICPASVKKGFSGFYIDNECIYQNLNQSMDTDRDASLAIEEYASAKEIYAPATFFINSAETNVYDKINEHYKSSTSKAQNFFNLSGHATIKKTDHILREILLTEESYLNMLISLQNDYLVPLSKILSHETNKCVSINIDILCIFHNLLYCKLLDACEGGRGRTVRICNIFLSLKKQFVEKYSFYFENLDDALERIEALSSSNIGFKRLLDEGQQRNSFSLKDLLVQPFQRMTKYHLFFKEIFSRADAKTESRDLFRKTWDAMEEICKYLNQCKKDQDDINKINFLTKTLASFKLKTELNLKEFGRFLKDTDLRKIRTTSALLEKDGGKKFVFLFEKAIIIISKSFNSYSHMDTVPIEDYLCSGEAVSHVLLKSVSIDSTTTSKSSSSNDSSVNMLGLHSQHTDMSYFFYFKTLEQRNEWQELLNGTRPANLAHHKHKFTLKNFERNIVECKCCNKYLNGIFFQGYKCEYCSQEVHRECLEKSKPCEVSLTLDETHIKKKEELIGKETQRIKNDKTNRRPSNPPFFPKTPSTASFFKAIEGFSEESLALLKWESTVNKNPVLVFNKGDFFYIRDNSDNETDWVFGYRLIFGIHTNTISNPIPKDIFKQEGYVQKKLLQKANMQTDLGIYSWYLEGDKKLAMVILERLIMSIRVQDKTTTFFMVRFRKEAGYAISICFNNKIKHIKINAAIKSGTVDYTIDNERFFRSIVDLVNFFLENSLVEYFSDIKSNLGKPYREVLPDPAHLFLSKNEYFPGENYLENKNQEIWLKRGHFYFYLEEFEHWCYVFDTDGLLGYVPRNLLKN